MCNFMTETLISRFKKLKIVLSKCVMEQICHTCFKYPVYIISNTRTNLMPLTKEKYLVFCHTYNNVFDNNIIKYNAVFHNISYLFTLASYVFSFKSSFNCKHILLMPTSFLYSKKKKIATT